MVESKKPAAQNAEEKMQRLEKKYNQLKKGKDFIPEEDFKGIEINETNMAIKCKKTIYNYEAPPDPKTKKKDEKTSSVNCVDWNQSPTYSKQFVTVDDMSRITLYNA